MDRLKEMECFVLRMKTIKIIYNCQVNHLI